MSLPLRLSVALTCLLLVATASAADDEQALRAQLAAHVRSGDDAALLDASDEVLARDPGSLPALEHRAFALQRLGRPAAACAAYAALLEASPDHVWALTRLGGLHADQGHWDLALARLRRAVELAPESADAQRGLVAALRGAGDVDGAQQVARAAREADAAAGWAWRAEAELAWTRGDIDHAERALLGAERSGTPDLDRLREVVTLDRRLLTASDDPATLLAAWAGRRVWTFEVRGITVRSSVGPRLPGDLVQMVRELPPRFAQLVGEGQPDGPPIVLRVSRTLDEHERLRRALFPQGTLGRAFTTATPGGGRGGAVREVVIYVCWTSDDVKTALAHEFAHAVLRGAARDLPVWLDEGIATYLEKLRFAEDEPVIERADLEATLRAAFDAGTTLSWDRMIGAQRWALDGPDGRARYAQAWSMVRFLLHDPVAGESDVARRGRLRRLVQASDAGGRGNRRGRPVSGRDAVEETYGVSPEDLDAAWRASLE